MDFADKHRAGEALDWVRRIHDPTFADWEGHVAWLEADPDNSEAFSDAVLLLEYATIGLASARDRHHARSATNDIMSFPKAPGRALRRRLKVGFGAAVAAALAAALAIPSIERTVPTGYMIQTAPGTTRTVQVDGTVIVLAGDSRLRLDHADQRSVVLERGEAFFDVRHDSAHPFRVSVGGRVLQDVGTQFDVILRPAATEIAVREGAVLYDPGEADVQLAGGQSLRVADHIATVQSVDGAYVGGWRNGQLAYRDAPLNEVAQDIARSIGEPVAVDPSLLAHSFSGVIVVDADHARMFSRMAAVMGVNIRRAAHGWQMVSPTR